ncbi:MAG TPA: endolytic transglycosylase MltG [Bryobacteraceae bacterium]|jgi:UPF0755 protein|nr:endolytic transglycosylase MltG [Bryobacteraceae bacterium]
MKTMRRLFFGLLLLLAAGAGALFFRVFTPYQNFHSPQFVDIPRGTSSSEIAGLLAHAGVVPSRMDFLLARIVAHGRVLQAGEYRFTRPASPIEVYDRIARGDVFYYLLAVPEGKNMFDIAAAVEQIGLFPAGQFLAAARNPAMIRDLDPQAPSLEGYLFPDTYHLSRHTTPEKLCRIMTGKFREVWAGLKTTADVHRTVTLASLVERESKLKSERAQVAAVYANRLRIGMKLDCDPTTIYAALLDGRYRGTIYRSDLESDSPYNTYRHPGLPPGPIANPGLAAIEAALHPADSEALYFVLRPDGSGGHEFSRTIEAQNAAVSRYRNGARR